VLGRERVWKGVRRGSILGFIDRRREKWGEERPATKGMAIDGRRGAGGFD
jgi:hypothetical protein